VHSTQRWPRVLPAFLKFRALVYLHKITNKVKLRASFFHLLLIWHLEIGDGNLLRIFTNVIPHSVIRRKADWCALGCCLKEPRLCRCRVYKCQKVSQPYIDFN
jgi:hypothetical protein